MGRSSIIVRNAYLAGFAVLISGCAGDAVIGGSGNAKNPSGTTLVSAPMFGSTNPGSQLAYRKLQPGPGWSLMVREDLAPAQGGRESRRTSLLSFVHLTDMHIIDPQSPGRFPYLRAGDGTLPGGLNFDDAYRAQDPFSAHVAEAMVQRINSLTGGPAEGKPFSFAVSTGDNGDWKSKLELQNYLNLLDGGLITTDTTGEGYVGVMDDYIHPGDSGPAIYDQYWHPDSPPTGIMPDSWKRLYGYPEFPGILDAATQNFTATGLNMPWYSGNGNHDGLVAGNAPDVPQFQDLLTALSTGQIPGFGSQMLLGIPPGVTKTQFVEALFSGQFSTMLPNMPMRPVPANPARDTYSMQDFIQMHLSSPGQPSGHGFTSENLANNTAYYTFDMAPGMQGIMLDTVNQSGEANGSIGQIQMNWLETQLRASAPYYYDEAGIRVETGNVGKYVVLFSHHNSHTMDNVLSEAWDTDPVKLNAVQFTSTLKRYPNVILWVNGHSHVDRIHIHPDHSGRTGGLWEINTASHIDWPQQARSIEILDNNDGTLSFFAVLVDHAGPMMVSPNNFSTLGLASISRELSANDPTWRFANATGTAKDRNVELLVRKPFNLTP